MHGGLGTGGLGPPHLKLPRAPDELEVAVVVGEGELDQFPALPFVKDSKQKVVESADLDVWEGAVDQGLLQKEAHERSLVVRVAQRSQAFQDASDAQVVMAVSVNEDKSRTKVITVSGGVFVVKVLLNLFAHMFRFSNLSVQFGARLTSPVFSSSSQIP